jgi:hypothetical protein
VPLLLPLGTTQVLVAPGQQYAVIEREQEGFAAFLLDGSVPGAIIPIRGAVTAPDFLSFSPSGTSAALVSRAAGRLQVIGALPLAPQLVRDIDIGVLADVPDCVAVSDDGGSVLYSALGAVYALLPDDSSRLIVAARRASISFFPRGAVAAIGDPDAGALWLFKGLAEAAALMAAGLPGLRQMAPSRDGRLLFATDGITQRIWTVTVADGSVSECLLPVIPAQLEPLRSADTFLISYRPGEPGWIVFRQAGGLASVFVPGPPREARQDIQ